MCEIREGKRNQHQRDHDPEGYFVGEPCLGQSAYLARLAVGDRAKYPAVRKNHRKQCHAEKHRFERLQHLKIAHPRATKPD